MIASRRARVGRVGSRAVTTFQVSEVILIALLVFGLALLPRVILPGMFTTIDEQGNWLMRADRFLHALERGDYAGTYQRYHPGVTTMWLGAAGMWAHEKILALGGPADRAFFWMLVRLPLALVCSLCVALAYPLLRRLVDARVALLAVLFWAADPFLVAHAKILHVDALLASFMTLSLLAALTEPRTRHQEPGTEHQSPVTYPLALSAVAAGLALLTKTLPALPLIPLMGLIALISGWQYNQRISASPVGNDRSTSRLRRVIPALRRISGRAAVTFLVWAGIVVATIFVAWPALWVDPAGVIHDLAGGLTEGAEAHEGGNFFLGQAVDDPGPWFYPVAIALRLTPWASIGLLLAAVGAIAWARKQRFRQWLKSSGANSPSLTLGLLTFFVMFFLVVLNIAAKKFDRYALPLFPALDILAAAGWVWLLRQIGSGHHLLAKLRHPKLGWGLAVLGLAANLAWYHPYELAYYNPLLGGGPVAERTLLIGWGEGLEQAGAYIAAQTTDCDQPVVVGYDFLIKPFICNPIVAHTYLLNPEQAGYAVFYISHLQRQHVQSYADALAQHGPPAHVVEIHGITYALIYALEPPVAHPLAADFGPALHLRGYNLDSSALQATGSLTLTLQWQAQATMNEDYNLFVHVFDTDGNRVGQIDVPLGGSQGLTSAWQPRAYITQTQPVPLPAALPPGTYQVALGVYHPRDMTRLPLSTEAAQPDALLGGNDALLLDPIILPPAEKR